jgi:hypothetical protein
MALRAYRYIILNHVAPVSSEAGRKWAASLNLQWQIDQRKTFYEYLECSHKFCKLVSQEYFTPGNGKLLSRNFAILSG